MNAPDDWSRWSEQWQREPAIDAERLRRRARWKRWRMLAMTGLELFVSIGALAQLVQLWMLPGLEPRWRLWCVLSLLTVLAVQYLYLHVRRGTWAASADSVPALLALSARRARAGIRLAWVNIASTSALALVSVLLALPELQPSRWLHDATLRRVLILQVAANGPLVLALLAFFAWYIRRQRRRLDRLQAWQAADRDASG